MTGYFLNVYLFIFKTNHCLKSTIKLKGQKSLLLICRSNKAGFGFFKTRPTIVFFSVFKYFQTLSNMVRQQKSPIKLYICNYVVCTRFNTASRTLSTLGQSTAVEKNRKQNFAQFFKQKVPIDWWNKWLPEGDYCC